MISAKLLLWRLKELDQKQISQMSDLLAGVLPLLTSPRGQTLNNVLL
jgi:hypothetical protein